MRVTGSEPGTHPLERFVAILAAILCVSLFFLLWRSLSSYQPIWPLPGLYFIEMAILAVLGAYVFLPGRAHLTAFSWGAAGAITAFSILGAFSVGALYLPAALMLAIVSLTSNLRNRQPVLRQLGVFFLAGLAQAALILAAASSGPPVTGPQTVPALRATDAATPGPAPAMTPPAPSRTASAGGLLPTLEAGSIRGALESALSVQTFHGVGGFGMRRLTGWNYGYRGNGCSGFRWLDFDHLLLYPSVGQVPAGESGRPEDLSPQPVVINLKTGRPWLPETTEAARPGKCDSVYWSPKLGMLIQPVRDEAQSTEQSDAVLTSTVDGERTRLYQGRLLGISPGGDKIMVGDGTLIDLASGTSVDFAWQIEEPADPFPKIFWSPDEKRVYRCCYFYGDTLTGDGYAFDPGELPGAGRKPEPGSVHSLGQWVRDGRYFLIEWDVVDDGYPDYFPMFDPVTKKYYELSQAAGIPEEWTCAETSVPPDGGHVWVSCWEGSYLVELATFDSIAYPGKTPVDIAWSSDGRFAWIHLTDETQQLLSVSSGNLIPLPSQPSSDPRVWWHPVDATLAYLGGGGQTLELLNAADMSLRRMDLPSSFIQVIWSPGGERLALLAVDGSIWELDYPALEKLDRLASPMPDVRDLAWSPDGAQLAFISGVDIYILEARI